MLVSRIPIVQYLSAFLFRAGIDNIKLTRCIATTPSLNPAKTTNGSLYIKLHNWRKVPNWHRPKQFFPLSALFIPLIQFMSLLGFLGQETVPASPKDPSLWLWSKLEHCRISLNDIEKPIQFNVCNNISSDPNWFSQTIFKKPMLALMQD